MHKALIVVFVANLILMAVSLAVLPDQVAIHFGGGGLPDSWASKEFNAAVFLVLEVPFFLMFYFAATMKLGVSKKYLNIPNKDYWLQEGNLRRFQKILGRYMAEFGVAIFIFFFCINVLAMQANLREPVKMDGALFMIVFTTYILYTLWWLVRLVRGFRIPDQQV
jgi:uncharacterized membrane protein